MPVTGGSRFKRHMRTMRREADRIDGATVSVGFHDSHIAALARLHEFGVDFEDASRIPSRPAFRQARPEMSRAVRQALRKGDGLPPDATLRRAGDDAADALRNSYLNAPGPDLSERQRERKGHDRKLIGAEGPRMIDHIESELDR